MWLRPRLIHGAVATARAALEAGATRLGVAMPEEGILLREAGIDCPILVYAAPPGPGGGLLEYGLTPDHCRGGGRPGALGGHGQALGGRPGCILRSIPVWGVSGSRRRRRRAGPGRLPPCPTWKWKGYSHFATADEADLSLPTTNWTSSEVLKNLEEAGVKIPLRHIANSGAIINLPESYYDLVQPWIIIYGLYPSEETPRDRLPLKPALSLKARVIQVKRVPPGTGISYGQIYHTQKATNIVTLPLGYADGWSRLLSEKARGFAERKVLPLVGRVCMDQCMADVGDLEVEPGEEAVLIGRQGEEEISADEVAGLLGTINYEVVCMFSDRVPRFGCTAGSRKKMKKR